MAEANNGSSLPSVVYVSYDGMGEPLGRSQVLAYLVRLAEGRRIALVSFEKPGAPLESLREQIEGAGIDWTALNYHRRPPVLSTALDVARGARAIDAAAREVDADLVHVRSYVPALMAMRTRTARRLPLLFDIRGFWADERVEGGIWPRGWLYRLAKRYEQRFFARADAVVTLTHASVPQIRHWLRGRPVLVEVIPTCVDPGPFASSARRADGPRLLWSGSVGTWYRFDLAVRMARVAGLDLTVLTRQAAEAAAQADGVAGDVREVRPEDIPAELHAGDIGLALIVSSFSKTASAPTRVAEYLASGMPIAVTPGVGDLERLVEDARVGVVVRDESDEGLREAARTLLAMAADDSVVDRCRAIARERFDAADGAARYARIYDALAGAT